MFTHVNFLKNSVFFFPVCEERHPMKTVNMFKRMLARSQPMTIRFFSEKFEYSKHTTT